MKKYIKKPVVIDAAQYTPANGVKLAAISGGRMDSAGKAILIDTPEGTLRADIGDYIIKGTAGEFYPCKPGIFADIYEAADGPMSFSAALQLVKAGAKIARTGWNGKNMYIFYQRGYPEGIPINKNTAEATGLPEGRVCRFRPYLMMCTADGSFVPWFASQSDLLEDDWVVVD